MRVCWGGGLPFSPSLRFPSMRGKCTWNVPSTLNQGTGTQTPNWKTTLHQHCAYYQTAAPSLSAEGVCSRKSQTGVLRAKGNTSDYKWKPYVHSLLLKWSESFHMSGIRISAKVAGKKTIILIIFISTWCEPLNSIINSAHQRRNIHIF